MVREAIEKEMAKRKMGKLQLSDASGVPKSAVYRFLDGSKRVELKHVNAMLKALGLTVAPTPPRRRAK
jgi:DNA-binding phage protein